MPKACKEKRETNVKNTAKLKDPLHKRNFSIALKNSFEARNIEDESVDAAWIEHRDITAAENTRKKSKDTEELVEPLHLELHRKKVPAKSQHYELPLRKSEGNTEDVPDERQRSKKRARADKRRTLERIAEEAENAGHQNNLKELYMTTNLQGRFLKKRSTRTRT